VHILHEQYLTNVCWQTVKVFPSASFGPVSDVFTCGTFQDTEGNTTRIERTLQVFQCHESETDILFLWFACIFTSWNKNNIQNFMFLATVGA
jgi:hypothetical protein